MLLASGGCIWAIPLSFCLAGTRVHDAIIETEVVSGIEARVRSLEERDSQPCEISGGRMGRSSEDAVD